MTRMLSLFALLVIILGIGFLFYRVIAAFLLPMFLALILVLMFRPLFTWMLGRCRGRLRLAAALTTLVVSLAVIVPLTAIAAFATLEGAALLGRAGDVRLQQEVDQLRRKLGLEMVFSEHLRFLENSFDVLTREAAQGASARGDEAALNNLLQAVQELQQMISADNRFPKDLVKELDQSLRSVQASPPGTLTYQLGLRDARRQFRQLKMQLLDGPFHAWLVEIANPTEYDLQLAVSRGLATVPGWLTSVGGATSSFVGHLIFTLVIMMISLYFFLADGPAMLQSLMELSPLDDRHERELWEEFGQLSRAVVTATLLSAAAQGLLGGVGYWLAGVGSVFLLTLLTALTGLIPFVGASAVWVPVCLWLFFNENRPGAAIFLAVYGVVVISMADNLIKPYVLQGQSNLHPLLALLSVLGGVQALGPIGLLVGPMVVALLQTLLKILHRELRELDARKEEKVVPPLASE